jgi:hypothetical protein
MVAGEQKFLTSCTVLARHGTANRVKNRFGVDVIVPEIVEQIPYIIFIEHFFFQ